ncbi:peptide/nickel transport system substrate-binding protein [Geodermatophilus pulveris]|uniref:Peptide/nickel transport system substrate-binding protein n=1 Tax=Geodermatophilus pulveris TaxID=1564159 RepID=A0A239DAN2_9ACTN|nr:ABC transporter family substrate-binding protein [Geodermatophilus pulveris]SNS29369.1 peptide/nickel transport system substrate-binding protein [Geodermatophilus pulveris]
MRSSKRGSALVASGMVGALALSACGGGGGGGGGEGGEAAQGGRVVYGESTDFPENLFPNIAAGNAVSTANILRGILPGTHVILPDFSVVYDENLLAEEPTLSTDGGTQVNTYVIRDEAVWSDGTPITADDFEFTWRSSRSGDPADGGCASVLSTNGYEQIASVEGSGENNKTVTVTYETPYSDWQGLFSGNFGGGLLPAHLMDNPDPVALCDTLTAGWPIGEGIVGDISGGPWQLLADNIDAGAQTVVLTPNPEWWGEGPNLDQLIVQNIGNDPTTAVQGLQSGELGVIYPQPQLDLVDQVEGLAPTVESDITFGLSFEHLDFNTLDPHLGDINVRRAFTMALDREEIVAQTVGQFSSEAEVLQNRIYFNNQPQYQDTAPEEYKQQNTDMARQLLEQSGYTAGPDGIYTHPQRGPLNIQIDTTANNPLRQQTIEVMIPQLREAGINATFNANPDIFAGADKPTSLEAGGFQAALFAWVGAPLRSPTQSIYSTPQGDNVQQNYSRQGTPEIDALFQQFVSQPDPDAQTELGNQIDAALWEQVATVPLYQKPTFIAYQSAIEGVEDNSTQAGPLWNSETWTAAQ